jgi:hypothetical protein
MELLFEKLHFPLYGFFYLRNDVQRAVVFRSGYVRIKLGKNKKGNQRGRLKCPHW